MRIILIITNLYAIGFVVRICNGMFVYMHTDITTPINSMKSINSANKSSTPLKNIGRGGLIISYSTSGSKLVSLELFSKRMTFLTGLY